MRRLYGEDSFCDHSNLVRSLKSSLELISFIDTPISSTHTLVKFIICHNINIKEKQEEASKLLFQSRHTPVFIVFNHIATASTERAPVE